VDRGCSTTVIASEAKQSSFLATRRKLDCFVAALLAMTEKLPSRRPLHQQRGDAAGADAHSEHPRARLAAGANLGHLDAGGGGPSPLLFFD
jgi:hypothetical protein